MRKFSFIATLVCSQILGINFSQAETIEITAIDWCPQICPEKEKPGYIIDIVNVIFEESPYKLNIQIYPWSRAILKVRKGKVHALLSPAKGEAPDLLYPKHELGIQRYCFITEIDSQWNYSGLDSLKYLNIGVYYDVDHGEINEYILQNKTQFDFVPYSDNVFARNLKKIKKGRINTFLQYPLCQDSCCLN